MLPTPGAQLRGAATGATASPRGLMDASAGGQPNPQPPGWAQPPAPRQLQRGPGLRKGHRRRGGRSRHGLGDRHQRCFQHFRGQVLQRITCAGAITVSQWQMFSSCRTLPEMKTAPGGPTLHPKCVWAPPQLPRTLLQKVAGEHGHRRGARAASGNRRRITFRRWNKSSRNRPSFTRYPGSGAWRQSHAHAT